MFYIFINEHFRRSESPKDYFYSTPKKKKKEDSSYGHSPNKYVYDIFSDTVFPYIMLIIVLVILYKLFDFFVRCLKKKRIYNTNRIGDFTSFDFGTPRRSSKNLKTVKTIVQNLRQKNKKLNQKNKRLEKKVASLNDMYSVLKQKSLITEFLADNMKVLTIRNIIINCWVVKLN